MSQEQLPPITNNSNHASSREGTSPKGLDKGLLIGVIIAIVAVLIAAIFFFSRSGGGPSVDGTVNRAVPASPFEMSFDQPPQDFSTTRGEPTLGSVDPLAAFYVSIGWDGDPSTVSVVAVGDGESSYLSLPDGFSAELVLNDGIAYEANDSGQWQAWDVDADEVSDVSDPSGMAITNVLPISRGHMVVVGDNNEIAALKDGNEVWRHKAEDFLEGVQLTDLALSADGHWVTNTEFDQQPVAINVENGTILPPSDNEFEGKAFMPLKDGILLLPDGAFAQAFDVVAFDQEGKELSDVTQLAHGIPALNYAPFELQYAMDALTAGDGDSSADSKETALLPDGQTRAITDNNGVPSFEGVNQPCAQPPAIVNNNARAVCVANGTFAAFDLADAGDSAGAGSPAAFLWALSGGDDPFFFHPFSGDAWLIENGTHVFMVK